MRSTLIKYLHIAEALREDRDEDEIEFARFLLRACFVDVHMATQDSASGHVEASGHVSASGSERRQKLADSFVAFFPPPWTGVMTHVCAGCCANRTES